MNQNKINLIEDIEKAKKTPGVKRNCNVDRTVENIMRIIQSDSENPFK